MNCSPSLVLVTCCALLKNVATYGIGFNALGNNFSNSIGQVSSSALLGFGSDQIGDQQLANLKTGDSVSINNVRYVALRTHPSFGVNRDRSGHTILVQSQDPYPAPGPQIVWNNPTTFQNNAGYSSAIPFGGLYSAGQESVNKLNILGFDGSAPVSSTYSVPPPTINRQTVVATVNGGAGVNDPLPLLYSTASSIPYQSVPGRDFSSYSSSSSSFNIRNEPLQNGHGDGSAQTIFGIAGQENPILSVVSGTSFDCTGRREGGYYADVESGCQVYHVCALGKAFSFLCPNGTIFDQTVFVCNWWYNVDCDSSPDSYILNDLIGVAQPSISSRQQVQAIGDKVTPLISPSVQQQPMNNRPFQWPFLAPAY